MMDGGDARAPPWFREQGITLLSQSSGRARSNLIEEFQRDVTSFLFGTDSFWQGVDVPGKALSNVIITRLPFEVPTHPLLEARLEKVDRKGGNRFRDVLLPTAVLKFKQGFGRLVRSKGDRGIVAVLDPRLITRPFGKAFMSSIPPCCTRIEDVG
jgi:ATP-dependent DNA helicase DinG